MKGNYLKGIPSKSFYLCSSVHQAVSHLQIMAILPSQSSTQNSYSLWYLNRLPEQCQLTQLRHSALTLFSGTASSISSLIRMPAFRLRLFFYHLRQNLLVPTLPQGSYLEGMLHFIKYSFSIYRSSPIFLPLTQSLVKYKTGFIIINLYFQNKTILVQSVYVLFHSMC